MNKQRLLILLSILVAVSLLSVIKIDFKTVLAQVQAVVNFTLSKDQVAFKFSKEDSTEGIAMSWDSVGNPSIGIGFNPLYSAQGYAGRDGLFSYARNKKDLNLWSIIALLAPDPGKIGEVHFQQNRLDINLPYPYIPVFAQTPTSAACAKGDDKCPKQVTTKEYVDSRVGGANLYTKLGKVDDRVAFFRISTKIPYSTTPFPSPIPVVFNDGYIILTVNRVVPGSAVAHIITIRSANPPQQGVKGNSFSWWIDDTDMGSLPGGDDDFSAKVGKSRPLIMVTTKNSLNELSYDLQIFTLDSAVIVSGTRLKSE